MEYQREKDTNFRENFVSSPLRFKSCASSPYKKNLMCLRPWTLKFYTLPSPVPTNSLNILKVPSSKSSSSMSQQAFLLLLFLSATTTLLGSPHCRPQAISAGPPLSVREKSNLKQQMLGNVALQFKPNYKSSSYQIMSS